MKNSILFIILYLFVVTFLNAKPLELRSLLKDRFEQNCTVRQAYDFHDENTDLLEPLSSYIVDSKYTEEQAYDLTRYQLKNTFYAGIPITQFEIGFGRPAQQYNEYLYFNLATVAARKAFNSLNFNSKMNANLSVEYKGKIAQVHCYWLNDYPEA
ncbi:hypothetical protein [Acinetobacter sp. P8-3-8]|uniref:hypothetical protein n=1 Tax=Acinetobacter sp. P8-3-8 TaxID=1029823 RepID=UPI0002485D63|nr:hypothetical protein [Acinetobacter sp. P8-3-8]